MRNLATRRAELVESVARLLDRRAGLVLCGFSILYLAGTCGRASQKLLWHDELFTLYLSRLSSMSDVWAAIATPSDGTPPLFHLLTRASIAVMGETLVSLRLPSILGFLAAIISLYVFVSRRYGRLYGLLASVLPVATNAYVYAYEARAYGVVLGLAGIAMVSWQAAAERQRRGVWLALLAASLGAAVSCHYYAVLLLAPIAAGESVRLWMRRTPDWPMWAAALSSLGFLAVLAPLIRTAAAGTTGLFSHPSARVVLETYEDTLASLVIPVVAAILVLSILLADNAPHASGAGSRDTPPPPHEWAAMAVLTGLPVLVAIAAATATGVFVARYALPWVWGFSVLAAWSAAALSRRPRLTAAVTAVTFLGWTAGKEAASARLLRADPPTLSETRAALLAERDGTLPIAVTHAHVYLPLAAYAPPEVASRLVALTQPDRVTARMGSRSGDAALIGLAKWAPLQVQDFDAFVRSHRRFLLYGPPMWLTGDLRAAGARLTLKGEDEQVAPFAMSDPGGAFLYEVEFERGK